MYNNYLFSDLTELIIKAYYQVFNRLGYGFLEKVYENALAIELQKTGLTCSQQQPIEVYYDNLVVGCYIADMIVNDCILLEIKAAESLHEAHEAQLTNYLRATKIEVGLLLNFGKKPEVKRKVFSNSFK